jgi:predicted dehydrogenase
METRMCEKLKEGVVGLGLWGRNHPMVYEDYHRSELGVVCDLDADLAERVAQKHRCDWTTSIDELAASDISSFSVATPDHTHFAPVSALLEAGKNVLVEKPLTTDIEQAKRLVELAEGGGSTAMVDYHLRWDPQWSMVKDSVADGGIGKPHMGYIRLSDAIDVAENWLTWADRSGPHWFLFPHIMDLMTWILDERPETIYATGHRGILESRGVDTWDAIQAMVSFPSGANITFETSWVVPNANPSITDCHMTLYGETGKIDYDQDYSGLSIATPSKFHYPWVPVGRPDRWNQLGHFIYAPMKYFVDCVLDDVVPECTFREGLVTTAMIEVTLRSLTTKQPVSLADVLS